MCGRYQLQVSSTVLQSSRPNTTWKEGHDAQHEPRQQVRPTNSAPVVVSTTSNSYELVSMKWGFSTNMSTKPLINARRETVLDLPTFRRCLNSNNRCAIPVSAFYEWHKSSKLEPGKQTLTPYLIHPPKQDEEQDSITYLAGIYNNEGHFVILTTSSSDDFEWLHSRQPVILSSDQLLNSWLDLHSVSSHDAVNMLLSNHYGLVCKRMLKDLSDLAPFTKEKKQKGITSFFSSPSSSSNPAFTNSSASPSTDSKKDKAVHNQDTDKEEIRKEPLKSKGDSMKWKSFKPVSNIKKNSNSKISPTKNRGKQKSMQDFFSKK